MNSHMILDSYTTDFLLLNIYIKPGCLVILIEYSIILAFEKTQSPHILGTAIFLNKCGETIKFSGYFESWDCRSGPITLATAFLK